VAFDPDARRNVEGREEERRWGRVVCLGRGKAQVFVDVNVCLFLLDTSSQSLRLPLIVRFGFPSLIHCPLSLVISVCGAG
jgi:hypothetical protein